MIRSHLETPDIGGNRPGLLTANQPGSAGSSGAMVDSGVRDWALTFPQLSEPAKPPTVPFIAG